MAMYYEQYILGEFSINEFEIKQWKFRQFDENQKVIELEIQECGQAYNQFPACAKFEKESSAFIDCRKNILW
jgi:hypothetical protein